MRTATLRRRPTQLVIRKRCVQSVTSIVIHFSRVSLGYFCVFFFDFCEFAARPVGEQTANKIPQELEVRARGLSQTGGRVKDKVATDESPPHTQTFALHTTPRRVRTTTHRPSAVECIPCASNLCSQDRWQGSWCGRPLHIACRHDSLMWRATNSA